VHAFVVTGDIEYLKDFEKEVEETKTRDKAVAALEGLLEEGDSAAVDSLNHALDLSNDLVEVENHAMRLALAAGNYNMADVPDDIKSIELTAEEKAMSDEELKAEAQKLVFGDDYAKQKDLIRNSVNLCTYELIRSSGQELENASARLSKLTKIQTALTTLFLFIILFVILIVATMVRIPLTNMVKKMQKQELIQPNGVEELRYVTRTYNNIMLENEAAREKLSHEASHDSLTGLLNRGAYDLLIEDADKNHMALILLDVDHFKIINDTYGHAVGDRILKKVAELMRGSFRSVDILCRLGGDEFVVVMTRVDSSMRQLVQNKIDHMNELLQNPKDDLPPASLSVGVAFSDRENPHGDIFRDADTALYQMKESGRSGCRFFEGEPKGEE
ncbi:MAG: GGDEF domain-containing protein, partial [Bacillota bacterium]